MKKFYQFIVFVLFGLALFILKDEVVSVIDKTYLSLRGDNNKVVKSQDNKNIQLQGQIDTPGALRVTDDIFYAISNKDLSKDKIIELSNKYRKENGNLSPLIENTKLDLSARKKMQDMFDNQYFEHESPSGLGVGDLGASVGYEYILIGENLAMGGFKNDLDLVDAWMNSPGHRANILNTHYTEIGVAVARGKFEGKDAWMAVQHFGVPKSVCPIIDQILYGVININQSKIKNMEAELNERSQILKSGAIYEGSTYNEQITKYNSLVSSYNNLLNETKIKINKYNSQIEEFNACLYKNK
jgi:uncharacterized protein YkwD